MKPAAFLGSFPLSPLALVLCFVAPACSRPAPPAPKPCCDQPAIPQGVAPLVVVADDVTGNSDEAVVRIRAGLSAAIKRDAVYPVLHLLYAWAMKRGPFEPIDFSAEVFADEAAARGGGKPIATVTRGRGERAPRCENTIPYDFTEQVDRAFLAVTGRAGEPDMADTCRIADKKAVARHDDDFKHHPAYKVDAARRSVEVVFPYLAAGKDEYAPSLSYNTAMGYWIDLVSGFFGRVGDLQEIAFVGVHDDVPVLRITTSRQDFANQLAALQEDIAAHSAVTFANLGMGKMNDVQAAKEQDAFKKKTYAAALKRLPAAQVEVSKRLK